MFRIYFKSINNIVLLFSVVFSPSFFPSTYFFLCCKSILKRLKDHNLLLFCIFSHSFEIFRKKTEDEWWKNERKKRKLNKMLKEKMNEWGWWKLLKEDNRSSSRLDERIFALNLKKKIKYSFLNSTRASCLFCHEQKSSTELNLLQLNSEIMYLT